ncbi:hypothetical protein MAM1_0820d11275, partial [Mucor ambiguus]
MCRFNNISSLHVFVVPNGELANTDPVYQTQSFLKAFNDRMAEKMRPGRHMCVDESMNQWLGNGMPNLKKVPRKQLHSVGQEYKTIADSFTQIVMRMDFCGSSLERRSRSTEDRPIVATVKRLKSPWHYSGRVIIADSWLGSPEMAQKLMDIGLYFIMQSTVPSEHLFVGAFRDLKAKALLATCSTTTNGSTQRFRDPISKEGIWENKNDCNFFFEGSVDTSNNRRDNVVNLHNVKCRYRWELRCLSFFLAVTEANTFSAFKFFSVGGKDVDHSEFRWRLTESLMKHIQELNNGLYSEGMHSKSHIPRSNGHSLVSLGVNTQGNYIRRQCGKCKKKTQNRSSCDTTALCKTCFATH